MFKVFVLEILKLESTRLRLEAFSLAARTYFYRSHACTWGFASKVRPPAVGSKPVRPALPIPNLGTTESQRCSSRPLELTETESSPLSCQLTLKSACALERRNPAKEELRRQKTARLVAAGYLQAY